MTRFANRFTIFTNFPTRASEHTQRGGQTPALSERVIYSATAVFHRRRVAGAQGLSGWETRRGVGSVGGQILQFKGHRPN